MRASRTEHVLSYAILAIAAAFALYPLILIILTALRPDAVGAENGFAFGNFADAWDEGNFGRYLQNSVVVAVAVVAISATVSSLAGYAFGTMRFRGSSVLFYLLLLGMMVPSEAIVIPLYFDLDSIGLTNTYAALILPQVAQSLAFGTFWMRAYFRSASREIVEAARMDGAGHLRVFWSILLPLVMLPNAENLRTAPLGLSNFQGQHTSGTALLAAGAVLVALPVVIVYLITQRHFIRGMIEGAVKG